MEHERWLKSLKENYEQWLPFFFLFFLNLYFATQTWNEIRQDFGWMRLIPQAGGFKLRHFVEFGSLSFFSAIALSRTFRLSATKLTILAIGLSALNGLLSELIQLNIPQRIPAIEDFFLNVIASFFGVFTFWTLKYFTNWKFKKNFLTELKKDLPLFSFIVGFTVFFKLGIFKAPILTDSWRLLTAVNNPGSDKMCYWLHIFTNPINGPQYRPISFFATFYWVRSFFGDAIWPYRVIGLMLFIAVVLLIFCFLRSMTQRVFLSLVCTLFFTSQTSTYLLLLEISHAEKYFLPLFELILGLYFVHEGYFRKPKHIVTLFIFSFLAIMSHEAAFILPVLFIAFDLTLGRKPFYGHGIILFPSFLYLAVRMFHFGIPSQGFMQVSWSDLPSLLARFLPFLISPVNLRKINGIPESIIIALEMGLLILVVVSLIYSYKKCSDKTIPFFLGAILLILIPFALLPQHFIPSRSLWASALFSIFIAVALNQATSKKWKSSLHIMVILVLIFFTVININLKKHIDKNTSIISQRQWLLKSMIFEQIRFENEQVFTVVTNNFKNRWVYNHLFPGFLAYHFPNKKFLLKLVNSHEIDQVYVEKGTYYKKTSAGWRDPFGFFGKS